MASDAPAAGPGVPPPTVLVLASGRGARFLAAGGASHKLRAPLAGTPVLERTLAAVRASGLPWHLEDRGHPGMGLSIAAAVAATRGAAGWLVLPGDLPLVLPATLRAVAAALGGQGCGAAVPLHGGRQGHPVGFAAEAGAALAALAGDRGAAPVLQALRAAGRVRWIAVDDPGIAHDIDTPDDLRRAEAFLAGRDAGPG
ncbi:MAG: NTP transferase domain-containing protein [Xylophilus ampelinus]